jgi:hypothetical protein
MKDSNEILEELEAISPLLAGIEKNNIFKVPEGYFIGLAEKMAVYAFLNQEKKPDISVTQQVPDGYFDSLSARILAKIKDEELINASQEIQNLSPVLFSLKDKNVFTVPAGYFEGISSNVLRKLNHQPAKVISIKRAKSFWKYAAAAILTGAIAISSLQIFNSSPDMIKNNSVVTESSGLPDYIRSSFQYKTPDQVNAAITTLSDDEIINYLETHGNIMDNDALTKDIDTKQLPAATDYLTDDNALNNYLNTIEAKSTDSINH